jgi:tetratricopeptide (TPR) repeat protein
MMRVAAAAAALLLAACAHAPRAAKTQHIEMDPMVFAAHPSGTVELIDPALLFEQAGAAYQDKRYTEAAERYDAIATEFGESRWAAPSLYNAGLALEAAGDAAGACERYRRLIARGAPAGDVLDAQFRLGGVHEQTRNFAAAADVFAQVLTRADLTVSDHVEAAARRGAAQVNLRDFGAAERTLREALAFAAAHASEERLDTDYFLGMTAYYVGEIAHEQYRLLPVRLPEKQLAADLAAKARMLLVAQARYLDAMRVKNADWATAAGFQIASLYREFYDDLVGAPVPPSLSGEAREVYEEEVKKQVRPLLRKAISVHERNVLLGERTGVKNEWVKRSNDQLDELKKLLVPGPTTPAAAPPAEAPATPPLPKPRDDVKPRVVM